MSAEVQLAVIRLRLEDYRPLPRESLTPTYLDPTMDAKRICSTLQNPTLETALAVLRGLDANIDQHIHVYANALKCVLKLDYGHTDI